ncbi:hypothetical protein [Variovorax sp. HJSM1_2]|uniref:hypothetical protein n=1 Tax=Variovorax sp. HJSM1_2 TaxID=3366263 RepID=UPI003BD1F91D
MLTLRAFLKLLGFAALAVLYNALAATTIRELWQPMPSWWDPSLVKLGVSVATSQLAWMQLIHGLSLLAAALPVALGIHLAKLQQPVVLAFLLSLAALVMPNMLLAYSSYLDLSLRMKCLMVLDLLKFSFTLPLLVWLLQPWRTSPSSSESMA